MRLNFFIFLTILFVNGVGWSQNEERIQQIKSDFGKWQPIITTKAEQTAWVYKYVWGNNYQFSAWYGSQQNDDTLTLSKSGQLISDDSLGTYIAEEIYSFSGDWFLHLDYYYDRNGQLEFLFWRLNTFYAIEPLTVEKRYYFSELGELIRNLVNVYLMGTKEKSDLTFYDPEVEYSIQLVEMELYAFWIKIHGKK